MRSNTSTNEKWSEIREFKKEEIAININTSELKFNSYYYICDSYKECICKNDQENGVSDLNKDKAVKLNNV